MADPFDELPEAAKKLREACKKAFDNPQAKTSCSHAVWHVLREMDYKDWPFREANDLITFLDGQTSKWQAVSIDTAFKLANQGNVVIGGLKNEGTEIVNGKKQPKHGHVIVVHPGTKIHSGGYSVRDKKTGKMKALPYGGLYPRALSRSLSNGWPGTVSCGDKTVRDPWSETDFESVGFWAPL